jgi:hypothetical protein
MAQKIVQYQAVLQLAQGAPQLYNMPLLHRQMLDVLGVKNANKLIPMEEDQKPTDPVSENQNILMMKPVKAFAYQDHQAHIAVHMSAMQDPKIAQLLQGNPMAPALQQAMMAHVNEHLGFQYRVEIEKQLGFALPPQKDDSGEDIPMNPEVESRLAPILAQAASKLLMTNQAQAAQQQAAQQAQDPIIQMQQQELQIKQAEQARKAAKDAADIKIDEKRIQVDAMKAAAQIKQQKSDRDIDALKMVAQLKHDKEESMRTHAMTAISKAAELAQQDASSKIGHMVDIHKYSNPQKKQETKKKGE